MIRTSGSSRHLFAKSSTNPSNFTFPERNVHRNGRRQRNSPSVAFQTRKGASTPLQGASKKQVRKFCDPTSVPSRDRVDLSSRSESAPTLMSKSRAGRNQRILVWCE